ncbi:MAG TPA: hypothetical protein VMW65_18365 [Chloroflexota bacterium]|nr:hypothetical protein [Chloroflexota bacterium]
MLHLWYLSIVLALLLTAALVWMVLGVSLLILDIVVIFRIFRGKVTFDHDGHY